MSLPPGYPGATPPSRPARPGAVTTAAIVMFVLSLASLAWAGILLVSFLVVGDDALEAQMRKTQPEVPQEQLDNMVALAKGLGYAIAALVAVLGIVLAVLAVLVLRGSQVARILSWVTAGSYVFCGVCMSASTGVGIASGARGGGFALLFPLVTLLGSLAVVILLALPVSNRYFARPVAAWEPPPGFGPATPPAAPPAADHPGPDTSHRSSTSA